MTKQRPRGSGVMPKLEETIEFGQVTAIGSVKLRERGKRPFLKPKTALSRKRQKEVTTLVRDFRSEQDWRFPTIYAVAQVCAVRALAEALARPDKSIDLLVDGVARSILYILPTCPPTEAVDAAREALSAPDYIAAGRLAQMLELTSRLRMALGIETIGACDRSREGWLRDVDDAARQRRNARRRKGPKRETVAQICARFGISRGKYYELRKADRVHPVTGEPLPTPYRGDGSVRVDGPYRGDESVPNTNATPTSVGGNSDDTSVQLQRQAEAPATPRRRAESPSPAGIDAAREVLRATRNALPSHASEADVDEVLSHVMAMTIRDLVGVEKAKTDQLRAEIDQRDAVAAARLRGVKMLNLFVDHPRYGGSHAVIMAMAQSGAEPAKIRAVLDALPDEQPTITFDVAEIASAMVTRGATAREIVCSMLAAAALPASVM